MSIIVTCNAGSTNTKLAAFDAKTMSCQGETKVFDALGIIEWLSSIGGSDIVAIGHRVVHGGLEFTKPIRITDDVLKKLKSYIPLAPLHQPAAIKMLEEAQRLYPYVPHIACFDTAFHNTMPSVNRRFALSKNLYEEGVIRYGFHGLSYQYITSVLPKIAGENAQGRVVVAHLGGGASACAMKNLKSVATTMGFSTLDGLMMGTRCGKLDAGVLLYLLQEKSVSPESLNEMLYHNSGLKGVSGISGDMLELLSSEEPEAKEAIELFCIMAAKEIAGLITSLGGLDALVFTGGIGEHAEPIREKIVALLSWIGDYDVHVIATNEELVIAKACNFLVS